MLEDLIIVLLASVEFYKVVYAKQVATHNSMQILATFVWPVTQTVLNVSDLQPIIVLHVSATLSCKKVNVFLVVLARTLILI